MVDFSNGFPPCEQLPIRSRRGTSVLLQGQYAEELTTIITNKNIAKRIEWTCQPMSERLGHGILISVSVQSSDHHLCMGRLYIHGNTRRTLPHSHNHNHLHFDTIYAISTLNSLYLSKILRTGVQDQQSATTDDGFRTRRNQPQQQWCSGFPTHGSQP